MNINNTALEEIQMPGGEEQNDLQLIHLRLEQLRQFMEVELSNKQLLIGNQTQEIDLLKATIAAKDSVIAELQRKLQDCVQKTEGNRQLINKLLGDIDRYQNDIDWYKRTYEKRSFWGVIKEKLGKNNENTG